MPPPSHLFTLAVTGGIATGKSTVCAALRAALPAEWVVFFDADATVHGLLTNPQVAARIVASLGSDVLAPDGALDRGRVSAKVFQDAELRKVLEGILHPLARQQCFEMRELASQPGSAARLFLADIPLFFETGFPLPANAILTVACAPQTQRNRLLARSPDRSPHQTDQRLAAQLPILDKVARASHVLWNGGTRAAFQQQLSLFTAWLLPKLSP